MNQPIAYLDHYLHCLICQLIHQSKLLFLEIVNELIQQGRHLPSEVLKYIYVTFQFLIPILSNVYSHEIN